MRKTGEIVVKETKYIASISLALSVVLQVVIIAIGKWDYTCLLGNILATTFSVLNFLLMGIAVEDAVLKEEKEAKAVIKRSQSLRQLMLFAVVAIGALVPIFNIWTTVIPLLFPRIAVAIRPLFGNNK